MRTFHQFLEDRGFQADACESLEDPDFYRLAASMHEALEEIADQGFERAGNPILPSVYDKGHRARVALGYTHPGY